MMNNEVVTMTFGERIKARREELGLSQDNLARKLGYKSRSTINKIELGKTDIGQAKIIALARALETTTGYLLGDYDSSQSIKLNLNEQMIIKDYRTLSRQGQEYIRQQMFMAKNIYQEQYDTSVLENIEGA